MTSSFHVSTKIVMKQTIRFFQQSNKTTNDIPLQSKVIVMNLLPLIPYLISPEQSLAISKADESIQLMYGYHTNIPHTLTWFVLIYGFYKIYFGVFKWLASF
jgi:hypothetical protein